MFKKLFQKPEPAFDAKDLAVLLAGLAVFAAISLATITRSSIWFDEAFSAYIIKFNFWDIVHYTATDMHPPLYYWLLKIWAMMFGNGELALRSLSVVFVAVAMVFGFLLVRRLFGRKAAWLSMVFLALAPMLLRYSQEIRMYGLAAAITTAGTYILVLATEGKRRMHWVIYGILVGLGMLTHYFTAVIWLAHWIWRAWVVRAYANKPKKFWRTFFTKEWIIAHAVAVGIFAGWLPVVVMQLVIAQVYGFWIPPVTPTTIPNFLTNVLYYKDQETVEPWLALLFWVVLVVMTIMAVRLYRGLDDKKRQWYMLLFMVAFVPMVLLFVGSMPPLRSAFIDRYLVSAAVFVSLFMGVTLALRIKTIRPLYQKTIAGLIVVAMITGLTSVYQLGNYNKNLHSANDTRQTLEAIWAKARPGEPIIADTPWLFYEAVFYDTPEHPVYFIDAKTDYHYGSLDMLKYNDQHKIKDIAAFEHQHQTIWYLARPAGGEVLTPEPGWKPLQEVAVNDTVNSLPAYKAIQYQTR